MESRQSETRRDNLKIEACVDPVSGKKTLEVMISQDRLHWVKRFGIGRICECAHNVPYVLQNPTAIFEGLCEDTDEPRRGVGWTCYCAIPPYDYTEDGKEVPPREGKVLLVFVNDEHVAYTWRWEKSKPDAPGKPINHETRFREQVL